MTACENLTKPNIQQAIAEAQEARSKRTEITSDRVLEELAKVGFANAGDYFDWGPRTASPSKPKPNCPRNSRPL